MLYLKPGASKGSQ